MKALVIFCLSSILLLGTACSSGSTDPTSTDSGSSLGGQNLANATVTDNNYLAFYTFAVETLLDDYYTGLNALSNYDGTDKTVNALGNYSGNLLVTALQGDTSAVEVPDISIEYRNFSNTGRFFYAGNLQYLTSFRIEGGKTTLTTWYLNGTLEFAGDYQGSIQFNNMRVGLESNGQPVDLVLRALNPRYTLPVSGSVVIKSGGNTISSNPNMLADHPVVEE